VAVKDYSAKAPNLRLVINIVVKFDGSQILISSDSFFDEGPFDVPINTGQEG
jgi:hypothetical protein